MNNLAYFEFLDGLGIKYSTVRCHDRCWPGALGGLLLEALRSTRHSSLPLCLSPSLLTPLKPPFDLAVPPQVLTWNVGHNPVGIYQRNGHDIMLFHARNFGQLQFD